MLNFLKNLFKSPKSFVKLAVDSLDFAVPFIAAEIDKHPDFNRASSLEKAQLVVDTTQDYLRKQFKLNEA